MRFNVKYRFGLAPSTSPGGDGRVDSPSASASPRTRRVSAVLPPVRAIGSLLAWYPFKSVVRGRRLSHGWCGVYMECYVFESSVLSFLLLGEDLSGCVSASVGCLGGLLDGPQWFSEQTLHREHTELLTHPDAAPVRPASQAGLRRPPPPGTAAAPLPALTPIGAPRSAASGGRGLLLSKKYSKLNGNR